MTHGPHVAVFVIGIRFWRAFADLGGTQPITLLCGRFEQAGFVVDIAARPAMMYRVRATMAHGLESADGIVLILLDVGAQCIAVARVVGMGVELVEGVWHGWWVSLTTSLPQVLAPLGADQPIDRVVDIVV